MNGSLLTVGLDAPEYLTLRTALAAATGCTLMPAKGSVPSDADTFVDQLERQYDPVLAERLGRQRGAVFAAVRKANRERLAAMRLLEAPELRGIVMGFDNVGGARVLAQAAVPTILVPHAVIPRVRNPRRWHGGRAFARHVCAPGPFSGALYRELGDAEIHATGRPCWDHYATLDRTAAADTARQALGLDPRRPLVVYAGSWLERNSAHATRHVSTLFGIYHDICRAVQTAGAQLVVKLHPGEVVRCRGDREGLVAGYTTAARMAGLDHVTVTDGFKEGLLSAAALVVVMNSNLGLEALLCERPVLNVPLIPEDAACLYPVENAQSAVWGCAAPGDVSAALLALLGDPARRQRMSEASGTTVREYVYEPDGNAALRVARVVADLVNR